MGLQRVFTFPTTPVAESIYVPNDPSCREYLRSQRPQLQTVFSHPETCVWGRVGYFLVPRELSERIGVMRVKKKGEWTKSGVPKNLLCRIFFFCALGAMPRRG